MELQLTIVKSKVYTKIHQFIKIPLNSLKKTHTKTLGVLFPFISWNFYTQKNMKLQKKNYSQLNIVCLERTISTSKEDITQTLFVMLVTFKRSGHYTTIVK